MIPSGNKHKSIKQAWPGGASLKFSGPGISSHSLPVGSTVNYGGTVTTKIKIAAVEGNDPWLQWLQDKNIVEIKLGDNWCVIDPEYIATKHPLDVGVGIHSDQLDLIELREEYDNLLAQNVDLQICREQYDDLIEQYKIIEVLKKEENDNAKI